jgi:quercetin dioxygenase-like cupin family protein
LLTRKRVVVSGNPMHTLDDGRRSLLCAIGAFGVTHVFPRGAPGARSVTTEGFVLGPADGERLVHFRDHGEIVIKLGSATGSDNLAWGTQQVMAGGGIPIHRHFKMDEAFCVLEGSGTFTLNDVRHPIEKGASIFIPRNSWHGFTNPDRELLLLWVVSPAGLEGFFRETCTPPGVPSRPLTREQIDEIARKYATEFR